MSNSNAVQQRTVVLVTPDNDLRERIGERLLSMRWIVLSASSGAEAMEYLSASAPEVMVVDHWLPDLDAAEFTEHAFALCPGTDLLQMNGSSSGFGSRSSRRNEVLHALREAQDSSDTPEPAFTSLQGAESRREEVQGHAASSNHLVACSEAPPANAAAGVSLRAAATFSLTPGPVKPVHFPMASSASLEAVELKMHLPEMVGASAAMAELARMVRMVAPHSATVLIQGETGTGKELVAKAVHRLSARASKAFVVLNCAAIPEHLLEAELFGHTRGAFTGAVTSRVGRIEAAHGGTLFLDEIGEMPLPLQAKMLRFLESGEIQRVGDNDTSRVDVRIVAATHQPLEANAGAKLFRLDLYHRLAVFPVEVPPLRSRREDIPMLVEFYLRKSAETAPRKAITQEVLSRLSDAAWEGNVRELCHVIQRAVIMAGGAPLITIEHLRMRNQARDA